MRYYTIGTAGHVDHGKTTLTKALTGVDTDRLKEEKERGISIELGYARFSIGEFETSIVDVPGHERLVRRMIAGAAGIDLVLFVVAADEGVMPQTREHLEILSFLGLSRGIVVVTKADKAADEELFLLVEDDIRRELAGTMLERAELVRVDSVTGAGLDALKAAIAAALRTMPPRSAGGPFRLAIDHLFALQGKGRVARGTVQEGVVREGDVLQLLPHNVPVKVRHVQVHGQAVDAAVAGQRAALLLGSVDANVARGDVLAAPGAVRPTRVVDVELTASRRLKRALRQRMPVKFYAGTSETIGTLVLFDRNELGEGDVALCQIRLESDVVVRRGDRFVVRRASPVETVGGGWVIDPNGEKYKFGANTIAMLERKREGTPTDRTLDALRRLRIATPSALADAAALDPEEAAEALAALLADGRAVSAEGGAFAARDVFEDAVRELTRRIDAYHRAHPMRAGMPKAECVQSLGDAMPKPLAETAIARGAAAGLVALVRSNAVVALPGFVPRLPPNWRQRMERAIAAMRGDGLAVRPWDEYVAAERIPPAEADELKTFLLSERQAFPLDAKHLVHRDTAARLVARLRAETGGRPFTTQAAKAILDVSRKPLIQLLELLDALGVTERTGEERSWRAEALSWERR